MPTSPTPADRPTEELAATIETVLRESLPVWWQTPPRLDWAALAVARQLLGTNVAAPPDEEQEPTLLRWGLDDVMYGDDDTTTVLLSGPDREPYWLNLDPERTAALRDALAGPAAPPAAPAAPEEQR